MSYWPTFQLTNEEKEFTQKYYDPGKIGRGVLRRMYPGHLTLTQTVRNPIYLFQIARRTRVVGLTMAGDVERFKIDITTSTGERHTADRVFVSQLLAGYNQVPQGLFSGGPANPPLAGWYADPYVFEPNIVLAPNQSLEIRGYQTENYVDTNYRIDFVLHVCEFPGMPGSPL